MNYSQVIKLLEDNKETKYCEFSKKLTPTNDKIYGVRVPFLRSIAKQIAKENYKEFLTYKKNSFEEKQLHGFVLGYAKIDYLDFVIELEKFSRIIDNWAVCDTACATFKIINKHKDEFLLEIKKYLLGSDFQIRLALVLLLDYYIEDKYMNYIFTVCDSIYNDNYYVKMATAWLLSVCFVKFPKQTEEYLSQAKLDKFTFNKTIQKITESYRVCESDKEKLKKMKVK